MPKYNIAISKTAQKQLDKIPDKIAYPLFDAIQELANDPRPYGYKKLKGRPGYRIRKGNFRIIYDVFDNVLLIDIISVGNRKDIYD
jgi:mRNA interferase RelE/StbE